LWKKPPLDKCVHERFFGITRADGSEKKPICDALREFINKKRKSPPALFKVSALKYYKNPTKNFRVLWDYFLKEDK
jgi:hypothetical protein